MKKWKERRGRVRDHAARDYAKKIISGSRAECEQCRGEHGAAHVKTLNPKP